MNQHLAIIFAAALAAAPAQAVFAQAAQGQGSGKIVRIDAAGGKIAIEHGAIPALDLPAMTLVYLIDPALLAGLAPGASVKFTAERSDDRFRIVAIK